MEESILTSTKLLLGITEDYEAFDQDVITHINGAFSTLNQLGIPADPFVIDGKTETWADMTLSDAMINSVKPYVYLRVRLAFDPPATSFAIDAFQKQLAEYEWRLSVMREQEALT